jgi:hypothetical protein
MAATVGYELMLMAATVGYELMLMAATVGCELTLMAATVGYELTLMAATVGYDDPNNLSHISCRDVQKAVTRSGFGLYISRISKPALNTVEAACNTHKNSRFLFINSLPHHLNLNSLYLKPKVAVIVFT